jgi:transporter family protein
MMINNNNNSNQQLYNNNHQEQSYHHAFEGSPLLISSSGSPKGPGQRMLSTGTSSSDDFVGVTTSIGKCAGPFHSLIVDCCLLSTDPNFKQWHCLRILHILIWVDDLSSPPLAVWIFPALCCALAYALYNIFIKKGSASINPVLGGVILQLVAALLGMVLLSILVYREGAEDVIVYDNAGIRWAVLAGVSVGMAEIVSFFVSSLGVQAMQSIPIIIGGSVMFGTTIGAIFLKEELTYRGWIGVVMISCGITLVGLDDTGEDGGGGDKI